MAIELERSTCQNQYRRMLQIMSTDDLSRVWVLVWSGAQFSGPAVRSVCVERRDLRALCLGLQVCSCVRVLGCLPVSGVKSCQNACKVVVNDTGTCISTIARISKCGECALGLAVMLLPYQDHAP